MDDLFCGCCGGVIGRSTRTDPDWCARCLPHVARGSAPVWERTWFARQRTDCPFQV